MPFEVYLEEGRTRVFAGALEWPGWCRSGKDEGTALEALARYGRRYSKVLRGTRLGYAAPAGAGELRVTERVEGDATTDFGAPSIAPAADARPLDGADLERSVRILGACWRGFDRAVERAAGGTLAKGPRGGGRELDAIVGHVVGAEASYARALGAKPPSTERDPAGAAHEVREVIVGTLERAAAGEIPERGPRGGKRWPPRYFVRRAAWHALDHAWEIEDRSA